MAFAEFCLFGFGPENITEPLITANLPPKSWITYVIKILFSLNLIFSYPLVIHPANLVLESYLFGSWAKTRRRQMSKNVSRSIIVALSCVVALTVYDKLDRFLGITGALTCTPIAFILPSIFHYKVCAETPMQRAIDLTIFFGMIGVGLFCTVYDIITFNTE